MDELYREASGGAPALAARPRGSRLFGLSGEGLRGLGFALLIVGVLIGSTGWYLWVTFVPPSPGVNDFQTIATAMTNAYARSSLMMAAGGLLALIGLVLLILGLVRPVSAFLARETSPAIGTVTRSAVEGVSARAAEGAAISPGWTPTTPVTLVRVKCRACGFLNPEEGAYCSKCGKPL